MPFIPSCTGIFEFWRNFNFFQYLRIQGLFRETFSNWAPFPGMNANFWSEAYEYDEGCMPEQLP